ncbi:MAG: hypothetical protein JST84_02405 [Acidobacteria bacterium]|nr:hypothetical protein [Acidobacteriota bacterium]
MITQQINLTRFFAWARERALRELETRLAANSQLDPNWTFSDIMQELLAEYQQQPDHLETERASEQPASLS